jgi:hypothetical protein
MDSAESTLNRLRENNPRASQEEIRRLFLDAVMNDPEIGKLVVKELQDQMFAFDADRAKELIRMMVDDDPAAEIAFASMLRDMRSQ